MFRCINCILKKFISFFKHLFFGVRSKAPQNYKLNYPSICMELKKLKYDDSFLFFRMIKGIIILVQFILLYNMLVGIVELIGIYIIKNRKVAYYFNRIISDVYLIAKLVLPLAFLYNFKDMNIETINCVLIIIKYFIIESVLYVLGIVIVPSISQATAQVRPTVFLFLGFISITLCYAFFYFSIGSVFFKMSL